MDKNGVVRHQQNGLSTVSNGLTELPRNQKVKNIAKIIKHVNRLKDFPLDVQEIVNWSNDIDRLLPDLNLGKLEFAMDAFKSGLLEWDKSLGIQNIFNGYKEVRETDNGFRINNFTW